MTDASSLILAFLREAWVALAGAFLAFALLAGIAQVLRVSSANVLCEPRVWGSFPLMSIVGVIAFWEYLKS